MDIVWIEYKIALVQEDMEYCLQHFGLDLDLESDAELLTSPFWVSYYSGLAEIDSPDFDEADLRPTSPRF